MSFLRLNNRLIVTVSIFWIISNAQESKVIELKSADRLEGKKMGNEEVRELIGNVHFVQKSEQGVLVKVWCDRAIRYMNQNRIELYGNVKAIRGDVTITTPEGIYYGDSKIIEGLNEIKLYQAGTTLTANNGKYFADEKKALFIGNVKLVDTSSVVLCDKLTYFEDETKSIAVGNVSIFDRINKTNIFGDSLVHIRNSNYSIIPKNPRMVQIDTTDRTIDTTVIISEIMESFQDTLERYVAINNVQMVKDNMASRCEYAIYYTKKGHIILHNNPVIWVEKHQFTGDTIHIFLENKKISLMLVKRHAFAISETDSLYQNRYNQLSAKELTFYFRENRLERIEANKTANSLYYLFDDNKPNGANKSSGDRIVIDFIENEVDCIRVSGGVQGQYIPEKIILGKEEQINLDGFRVYTNKPRREGLFLTGN